MELARLDHEQGLRAEPWAALEQAEMLLRGFENPMILVKLSTARAHLAAREGDQASALAHLDEVRAIAADADPESLLGRRLADLEERLQEDSGP